MIDHPRHPYLQALLAALPPLDPREARAKVVLPLKSLDMPDPTDPPPGCAFHPRCPYAEAICERETPKLAGARRAIGAGGLPPGCGPPEASALLQVHLHGQTLNLPLQVELKRLRPVMPARRHRRRPAIPVTVNVPDSAACSDHPPALAPAGAPQSPAPWQRRRSSRPADLKYPWGP